MSQQELLTRVLATLDGAGIDYMVTGSVVSSLQGEPRATHDVDLVVALAAPAVSGSSPLSRPPNSSSAKKPSVKRYATARCSTSLRSTQETRWTFGC